LSAPDANSKTARMTSEDDDMEEALAGGRLTVDLGALAANWRTLAGRVKAGTRTAAAVKGDGYGIGLSAAGEALARAGCAVFFVALPEEGVRLRRALPSATIYVLAGLTERSVATFAENDLSPVLNTREDIDAWAAARRSGAMTGAALHVDTGMNRLGVTVAEALALGADRARVAALAPTLVMSHLACATRPSISSMRSSSSAFAP
jgi:alanine racemase